MNITDQQKLLVEESKRRRQAAMADYEHRQSQAPQSVDSQFASVFPDTSTSPAGAAEQPTVRTPDTVRPIHPKLAEVLESYGCRLTVANKADE